MIKKQALSLLFSLLFSSLLVSTATAQAHSSKSASRPVRIAKSTISLMGHTGLTLCSGIACYICGAIGSDSRINIIGVIGLVPSCYGLWGGAKGMLSAIKGIAHACHNTTQACDSECSHDNPVTA